jgi:hypothetical protein
VRLAVSSGLVRPEDIETVGDEAVPADPPYILPESGTKGATAAFSCARSEDSSERCTVPCRPSILRSAAAAASAPRAAR